MTSDENPTESPDNVEYEGIHRHVRKSRISEITGRTRVELNDSSDRPRRIRHLSSVENKGDGQIQTIDGGRIERIERFERGDSNRSERGERLERLSRSERGEARRERAERLERRERNEQVSEDGNRIERTERMEVAERSETVETSAMDRIEKRMARRRRIREESSKDSVDEVTKEIANSEQSITSNSVSEKTLAIPGIQIPEVVTYDGLFASSFQTLDNLNRENAEMLKNLVVTNASKLEKAQKVLSYNRQNKINALAKIARKKQKKKKAMEQAKVIAIANYKKKLKEERSNIFQSRLVQAAKQARLAKFESLLETRKERMKWEREFLSKLRIERRQLRSKLEQLKLDHEIRESEENFENQRCEYIAKQIANNSQKPISVVERDITLLDPLEHKFESYQQTEEETPKPPIKKILRQITVIEKEYYAEEYEEEEEEEEAEEVKESEQQKSTSEVNDATITSTDTVVIEQRGSGIGFDLIEDRFTFIVLVIIIILIFIAFIYQLYHY